MIRTILLLIALLASPAMAESPQLDTWMMLSPSGKPEIRGLHSKALKGWDSYADTQLYWLAENSKEGIEFTGVALYNPWGAENPYEWDGRIRCQQAVADGNDKLAPIVDDDAMLRCMNKLGDAGYKLLIYVGSSHRIPPLPGESKQAWCDRVQGMLGAVNHYRGDLTIGMDATYGHGDHHPDPVKDVRYRFTGGRDGSVAMLTKRYVDRGITVLYESNILSKAHWAHNLCGCLIIDRTIPSNNRGLPVRVKVDGVLTTLDWGNKTPLHLHHHGPRVVQASRLKGKSANEINAVIDDWHDKGCSVIINAPHTPGYH